MHGYLGFCRLSGGMHMFRLYVAFLAASFLASGHLYVQMVMALMWVMLQVLWIRDWAREPGSTLGWLRLACMGQWPGLAAVAGCAWRAWNPAGSNWGEGLLEVWTHPFLPLLERMPGGIVWNHSDVFWASCVIPPAIVLATVWYGGRCGQHHLMPSEAST